MSKNIRLNQELSYLKGKKQFKLQELMETFQISKRTALRDIQDLEEMGLPLYSEPGRGGGYHILPQERLIPITMSQSEVEALFYALKALQDISSSPFDNSYHAIIKKLQDNLSQEQLAQLEQTLAVIDYYKVPAVNNPKYLPALLRGILEGRVLRVTYDQYEVVEKNLQFYDLYFREGVWFSHAYDSESGTWAVYRCDCIKKVERIGQQGLERQKLTILLEEHEKAFRTIPFRCRLTPFGKELFAKNHYESMYLVQEGDEVYLQGYYNSSELHYLTHYLVEYGKHLNSKRPIWLI